MFSLREDLSQMVQDNKEPWLRVLCRLVLLIGTIAARRSDGTIESDLYVMF
jgi:hypothetical protein